MLVDSADHRGVDLGACLAETGLTRARLTDTHRRLDWDVFVVFLAQLERACGGPDELAALFAPRTGERTGHPFVRVAGAFFGTRDLYRLLAWAAPRDIAGMRLTFEDRGTGLARLTTTLDPTRAGSLPFHRSFQGVVRKLPSLVDLPDAKVVLTASPHRAVYDIEIPAAPSLAKRARRAVKLLSGASATLEALEAQAAEIRAKNDELEAQLTAQREVESALREREAFLKLALEAGRLGIWSWDVVNDRFRWSVGTSHLVTMPDTSSPQSFAEYLARVHADDREQLTHDVEAAIARDGEFESEHRVIAPDESVVWVRANGRVLRHADGSAHTLTGTATDISEKKKLETQLLLADRMSSVGKVAAGVAHELNNPLAYVITNAAVLEARLARAGLAEADARALRDSLGALVEGAQRMRDIMDDLRTFSRPEDHRRVVVDLRRIVESSMRLVSNEIRHRADVVAELADEVPKVLVNESRLGQVLINLLVNAVHAIPDSRAERGLIKIRTYRDADGCAVTSVEDNGTGITPDAMRRLFEPFFTTKDVGQGTGLGLAVCESIVTSFGGRIEVESKVGHGSTFRVVLPAATARTPAPRPSPSPAPTGGRILVIDDEPRFRTSLELLLRSSGFDVVLAETGETGVALARGKPPFDVILCDLMMPRMTGMDVHEELQREQPDVASRMVFLTGGAFTPRARAFFEHVPNQHVDKPFELDQLLRVIEIVKGETGTLPEARRSAERHGDGNFQR